MVFLRGAHESRDGWMPTMRMSMSNIQLRTCVSLLSACIVCIGLFPRVGFASPPSDPVQEVVLRVPGMTESFTMVLCPEAIVETEDGFIEIPSMYVLSTEVTWDLYDIFVYKLDEPEAGTLADAITRPSKPYVPPDRGFGHEGYPAIGMTQIAAQKFCDWLSLKSGLQIRLPNQAEWSYLATAGQASDFCCGIDEDSLSKVGWHSHNSEHSTHPVAQLEPNAFGLFDMHGNAAEWVTSESRKPLAFGGGYRDTAMDCTANSFQRQKSSWNQSDPQIPKSQWWLADCSWVGIRFVVESDTVDLQTLEGLKNDTDESD